MTTATRTTRATRLVRAAAACAALFALLVAVATAKELGAGARAVRESDAAAAKGDFATAIARARDAAEAMAPGSPYAREGYARLEALARAAEARRDAQAAVAAWGAMRAAATATSSPLARTGEWRALGDEGIARAGADAQASPGEVHATDAMLRGALEREDAPPVALLALLGLGALAFFAGAARLAFAARDVAAMKREKLAFAAAAVGAAIYAVACFRA